MQLPMAIDSRPVVKDTEAAIEIEDFLVFLKGRSVARLYSFDEGLKLMREWSDLRAGLVEMTLAGADRKFQILLIGGRVLLRLNDGSRINTAVKCRSELVKHFSQFERELIGEAAVSWADPNAPCPIGIHIHAGRIGVFLDKTVPHLGEGYAVGVCPFDTLPAAVEW